MFIATAINGNRAPEERKVPRDEYPAAAERKFAKYFGPKRRTLAPYVSKSRCKQIVRLLVVVLCALALKYFYSTASVNELRWILAPTTQLVELISGERFQFEPYAGYINRSHTFVIAASCAGLNFLLTAFLMLALRQLWRQRSPTVSWSFLPVTAALAYVATIITNTVRITTALQLRELHVQSSWLSAGQIHRLEGIFVYFGFLLLLYVLTERLSQRGLDVLPISGGRPRQSLVFPLVIYYGTTLGIPLLNGSFRQAEFWEHSVFVLLAPLVLIIPLVTVRNLWRRRAPVRIPN